MYLADAQLGGLRIIDVSNPDAPTEVGFYNQDCEYLGSTAYDATFEMVFYENGPWGGIDFNLEAYDGDTLVARDSFTIVGDDPNGRDNIAFSSLSVEAPSFDSLYLYATYQGDFSAPRLMIDNLTITPVAEP